MMDACEKCAGLLVHDRETDMNTGMTCTVLKCVNCGKRHLITRPRPLVLHHIR